MKISKAFIPLVVVLIAVILLFLKSLTPVQQVGVIEIEEVIYEKGPLYMAETHRVYNDVAGSGYSTEVEFEVAN